MPENNAGGNSEKKYYQEDVRYYVREDGQFIPVYSRTKPKVEPPIEKVIEKPFNVENYEILKYHSGSLNSSEEPFTDEEWETDDEDDAVNDDDNDGDSYAKYDDDVEDGFGFLGLEEKKVGSEKERIRNEETDADDEYENNSSEETSDAESCWTEFDSEETHASSKCEEDPEEIKEVGTEDLQPFVDEILKGKFRDRPFPKKWKPNPYMSTLVYRDKITESDKEEMKIQKEMNKIKIDDLKLPTDEEVKNFVLPKLGDENYMGELACDPNVPFISLEEQEKEVYGNNFDDVNEVEVWPKRDYQSDFVTDTSELYSTLTEASDSDLEPLDSDGPVYPIQKPEEYMEPEEMNLGDHQYQKIPINQPQVRIWYDWHGDQYLDVKNRKGEWETVEKVYEEYPIPKPKHSEHFWKKKGEEQGFYPKKCSPYDYPPDEDGYYHHCPGYNHIPGSENWKFYDDVEDEDAKGYDSKTEGEDSKKEDDYVEKESEGEEEVEGEKEMNELKEQQEDLRKWQDYVTQSLRTKQASNKAAEGNPMAPKNSFEKLKVNSEENQSVSVTNMKVGIDQFNHNNVPFSESNTTEGKKSNINCNGSDIDDIKMKGTFSSSNQISKETNYKEIESNKKIEMVDVDVINSDKNNEADGDRNPNVSKVMHSLNLASDALNSIYKYENETQKSNHKTGISGNSLGTFSNHLANISMDNMSFVSKCKIENDTNASKSVLGLNLINDIQNNIRYSKVDCSELNVLRLKKLPLKFI